MARAAALRISSPEKAITGVDLHGGPITIGRAALEYGPDVSSGPAPSGGSARRATSCCGTWPVAAAAPPLPATIQS